MVEIRAFEDADLFHINPSVAPELLAANDWRGMVLSAAHAGPSWTALLDDGRIIGCAGLAVMWPGRGHAWCLLARNIPQMAWPSIHRAVALRVRQALGNGFRRIEAEVVQGFEPGMRWMRMLGFEREGVARCYGARGEDFVIFAKVNNG